MKLKPIFLETVWRLARALVLAKRALVWGLRLGGRLFDFLKFWYKKTIGFAVYKVAFYGKRRLFPEVNKQQPLWMWFGERWVLQLIAFAAGLFLIWPQTKLYQPEFGSVPGKNTLLYALVGPGEQDFSLAEDVPANSGSNVETKNFVQTDVPDEWAGVTIGGALVKPYLVSTKGGTASVTPTPSNRVQIAEHQVKSGEVLSTIAREYNLKIETILWANNLTTRSLIRPGDVLKIPPADGAVHTVKKGETVSKIAQIYSVPAEQIISFNGLNEHSLKVGTVLLVPGATKAPVVVAKPNTNTTKPNSNNSGKIPTGPIPPPSSAIGSYIWPSGAKIITQYYGLRHTGVDIAGPQGLPNYAARDGVVIKSQDGYNGGYGNYIIIDHGGGITTLYGHNFKRLVSVGETVSQGQVIGLLGTTGRSTGPHLHFEVRVNNHHTNPLQYIRR